MKKSDISKVLKENGYGFVKVSTGNSFDNGKCYTGFDGKSVKGIAGGSRGPMTVTNAYEERNQSVIREVTSDLKSLGMSEEDGILVSNDGKIKVSFVVNYYPAYTRSAGYDESYENAYIQPVFIKG